MRQIDQLLEARWVIPVEPSGVVLEHHAVALAGDLIADILPINVAREKYTSAARIDLSAHALIPGLVNTHTHNAMTLMRGLADSGVAVLMISSGQESRRVFRQEPGGPR